MTDLYDAADTAARTTKEHNVTEPPINTVARTAKRRIDALTKLVVALAYHDDWTLDAINNGWLDELGDHWCALSEDELATFHDVLVHHAEPGQGY